MPYVTSVERRGIQQGIQQGIEQGVLQNAREAVVDILEVRFGNVPQSMVQRIHAMEDLDLLKMLHRKAATVPSLEEFEATLDRKLQKT